MELKIVGGIDSIVGFAETSAQAGDIVSIRTQGSYFSKSNLNDPSILSIKNQISSIMATHVFPLFINHFSSKDLPEKVEYVKNHLSELELTHISPDKIQGLVITNNYPLILDYDGYRIISLSDISFEKLNKNIE